MKKHIFGFAIVIAAVFGFVKANLDERINDLQIQDVEAIADPPEEAHYLTGPRDPMEVEITIDYYSNNTQKASRQNKGKGGSVSAGGNVINVNYGGSNSTQYSEGSSGYVVKSETKRVYMLACKCENSNYCVDYIP